MKKPDLMNDQKKSVIWAEWGNGSPMIQIARAIEKPPATVFSYLRYHGGIAPRIRTRALMSLTIEEREEISRELAIGQSIRSIATKLRRSPSTISQEINKNGGVGRYRAAIADKAAWRRAKRPKPCVLTKNAKLRRLVTRKLSEDWSPEQISGWLKLNYPENENLRVSHETIYKSLFIQKKP